MRKLPIYFLILVLLTFACQTTPSVLPTLVPTAAHPLETIPSLQATYTPASTTALQVTYTPLPTYTAFPTYTPYPTAVPQPTVYLLPTLTSIPSFVGTEAEFKAYIRSKYSTVAGNTLEVEDVTIFNEGGELPLRSVSIRLSSDSAFRIFGEQTRADAMLYGTNLLRDAVAYFGGEDCLIRVYELFYTDYLSDTYFDEEWYYIGDYDLDDGWPVYKDYVNGYYSRGLEEVNVWNYK